MAQKEKIVSQGHWIIDAMVEEDEDKEDYWRLRNNVIGMYMSFDDVAFAADLIMFKREDNSKATFKKTAFDYRIKKTLQRISEGWTKEDIESFMTH